MMLLFSCSNSNNGSNIEHLVFPELPASVGNDILKNNTYKNSRYKYEFGKDGSVKYSALFFAIDKTELQPEYIFKYTYNDENKMLFLSKYKINFSLIVLISKKHDYYSPILALCDENKGFLTYSEILSEINSISYDDFKKAFSNATETEFQQEKREVLLRFKDYSDILTYKVEQTENDIALRDYYSEDVRIQEGKKSITFCSLENNTNSYTDTSLDPVNELDSALVIRIYNENPDGYKGEVLVDANSKPANSKSYTISEITYWSITAINNSERIKLIYNQSWDDGIIVLTVEGADSYTNRILNNKSYILYSNNLKTILEKE